MPPVPAVPCPFCGSARTRKEADFGTSVMVNRQYCHECRSSFEAIKWGSPPDALDVPGFLKPSDEKEPSHG
jgi:hypothetical protein